jgi:hypothetical protein
MEASPQDRASLVLTVTRLIAARQSDLMEALLLREVMTEPTVLTRDKVLRLDLTATRQPVLP